MPLNVPAKVLFHLWPIRAIPSYLLNLRGIRTNLGEDVNARGMKSGGAKSNLVAEG